MEHVINTIQEMENQTPFSNHHYNTPQNNNNNNNIICNNNNNNNNNMSCQMATVPPSPTASTSSSVFKGCFHRAKSDGYFDISAAELFPSGGSTAGDDDLASVFLDFQELAGMEEDCRDEGGGDDMAKRARGRPRIGSSESVGESKKAVISSDMLDELKALDPKRAKRILANRQSAARSKERKARYLVELERRIRALQIETVDLTAQLRIYQRDTSGLTTENAELKIRLQVMEQQAQLRDALNEALRHEVDRLKVATGELKTPTESYAFGGSRNVSYSPLASPSTINYSPQPSPSAMQTASYSPSASPQTSSLFPLPKQLVPMLSPLPPLHNSRSALSNRRFHRLVPEQDQGFENIDNRGVGLVKTDN